jgi:hypothetical protein
MQPAPQGRSDSRRYAVFGFVTVDSHLKPLTLDAHLRSCGTRRIDMQHSVRGCFHQQLSINLTPHNSMTLILTNMASCWLFSANAKDWLHAPGFASHS